MKTNFPIFDKRDGAQHQNLQFKTWTEILSLPWNAYLDRSISCYPGEDPNPLLSLLFREAKKRGETVIAAAFHNFAVSIAVSAKN